MAGQDASDEPLLLDDERVDRLVEQRSSADQAGEPEPKPNERRGVREQGGDDAIADIARVDDTGVERGLDLRLEPDLFVEADLEVGEVDELRSRDRVRLEARALVVGERLTQVPLAGRRLSRSEALHEPCECIRVVRSRRPHCDIEARELAADLGEHPDVARGDRRARPIQGRSRIDDRPHGRERRVDRDARAEPPSLGLDIARGLDRGR